VSIARERLIALASLVFSVLVMATSVEIGRNAIAAALSGLTAYGTVALVGALALSVGLRKIWKASKTVLTAAVVIALVLFGMGKALAEVVS
jgi:divalent metal cation (Fe/Co/Zn/Cd) transporter